jgi:hypothetical protein
MFRVKHPKKGESLFSKALPGLLKRENEEISIF